MTFGIRSLADVSKEHTHKYLLDFLVLNLENSPLDGSV